MTQPRKLCLIHTQRCLEDAFRALGCEVLALAPAPGSDLDLPAELAARSFAPDLVFQQELLEPRVLLRGLDKLSALRVFWALDPHLNAFWQAPYLRLFDLGFSTQKRWLPDLAACGAEGLRYLPWYAPDRPFTPFAERTRDAGFVGRLGPMRPARNWLVELLGQALPGHGTNGRFEARADLDFEAMLDFYQATRVIPNESITGEVNFRLFEAAGCGAVLLAQDLGPEQAELLAPGREMLVCADALELVEHLRMLLARPRLAEALGRAAWERAQAEHLPIFRARAVLEAAAETPRRGAEAADTPRWLALALAGLLEAGRLDACPATAREAVATKLAALPHEDVQTAPHVLAARVRVAHTLDRRAEAEALLLRCRDDAALTDLRPLLACSMFALRRALAEKDQSLLTLALALALRAGITPPPDVASTPISLLLAWHERLEATGDPTLLARGGFSFDAERHLPGSASECLYWAAHLAPADTALLRKAAARLGRVWGAESPRLGLLTVLTLRDRADWRAGLDLGLLSLRLFRAEAGLSELALAEQLAAEQSQTADFSAALDLADPSGRLRRHSVAGSS